jgi:CubicO group peptidase (beta-lactamase class C family)
VETTAAGRNDPNAGEKVMYAPKLGWLRLILRAALASALLVVASHAAPPADLDRYAGRVLDTFQTPGMVLVLVERERPSVVRTYGLRRIGQDVRVDDQTLFAIGSTTKAFTSALLAMLVDEGKLQWDTKVSDVLPGFKMYDPYASSEMTVRDLLVHRSGLGLGAGDLLFYPPTDLKRAEIVHQLRFIKPATSFRSGFAYDNLLYIVAGQLIEAMSGKSWEDYVRERLLTPLQMDRTSTSSVLPANANRAWPHARISGEIRGVGPISPLDKPLNLDNAAPAGALNTSGAEIARWLELQLNRGVDPRTNTRLWSKAQAREMWTAQTLIPIAPNPKPLELAQANFRAYALGWIVSDYRGQKIVAHGGGVPGMVTLLVIVPGRDVAFAILCNAEETAALSAVQYRLLDHYLGLKSPDWIAALAKMQEERFAKAREQLAKSSGTNDTEAPSRAQPSLPIADYAGRYRDAWYGPVMIESRGSGLNIHFAHTPAFSGPLEHVRNDTFRTRWADRTLEDAYVTFALNPDGSVEKMTMRAISPLADFSFDFRDLLFVPEE